MKKYKKTNNLEAYFELVVYSTFYSYRKPIGYFNSS
jgi:hypothetical protein